MLPAITMETEASHMLEAALEQMDDIIAGKGQKATGVNFELVFRGEWKSQHVMNQYLHTGWLLQHRVLPISIIWSVLML